MDPLPLELLSLTSLGSGVSQSGTNQMRASESRETPSTVQCGQLYNVAVTVTCTQYSSRRKPAGMSRLAPGSQRF